MKAWKQRETIRGLGPAGALVCVLLAAALAAVPPSAIGSEAGSNGTKATEITASSMSYSHETSTVVFSGDVRVKRPDFTLWCQELTVHVRREAARALQSEESGGTSGSGAQDLSRQFEKIIAEKEVRLVMSDREATGSKAVYQAETQTLTLQGEVVLKEGKNRIQGEKVTFYMDEDRTEIDSGGQDQVKALFFPSEDGESADGVPSGLQSE